MAMRPLGEIIILFYSFCCVGLVLGQSWPLDSFKRVRLEGCCRTHLKVAPQTNSKSISWLTPCTSQKRKCKMTLTDDKIYT